MSQQYTQMRSKLSISCSILDRTPMKYIFDNSSANLDGRSSPLYLQSTILGLAIDTSVTSMPQSNLWVEICSISLDVKSVVNTNTEHFFPIMRKSVTPLKGVDWHTNLGKRNMVERCLLQLGPSFARSNTVTPISFSLSSCFLMQKYKRLLQTDSSHPTPTCSLLAYLYFPHNAVNSEGLHAHLGASSVGVVKRLRHKHSCAASMG